MSPVKYRTHFLKLLIEIIFYEYENITSISYSNQTFINVKVVEPLVAADLLALT